MTVNLSDGGVSASGSRQAAWLWPLVPFALATFALAGLVTYQLHADAGRDPQSFLQHAVVGIYAFLGFVPAFFFFLLVMSWSTIWFFTGALERPGNRLVRISGLTLALAVWVNLQPVGTAPSPAAGWLGAEVGGRMLAIFGHLGSVLVVAPLALAALFLATDFFFYRFFEGMHARLDRAGTSPHDGVETQVTEHLKGLQRELTEVPEAASAPAMPQTVESAPAASESMPRRRSSFERRQRARSWDIEAPQVEADAAAAFAAESIAEAPVRELRADDDGGAGAEVPADELEPTVVEATEPVAESAPAAAAAPEPVWTPRRGRLAPIVVDEAEEVAGADDAGIAAETEPTAATAPAAPLVVPPDEVAVAPSDEAEPEFGSEPLLRAASAGAAPELPEVASSSMQVPTEASGGIRRAAASVPAEVPDFEPIDDDLPPAAEEPPVVEPEWHWEPAKSRAPEREPEPESEPELESAVVPGPEAVARAAAEDDLGEVVAEAVAESAALPPEPMVAIPRPPEGVRQQRLFVGVLDEALVREAIEVVTSTRRASAAQLQRKLRIDFDQAMEVLHVLAHRGVIELAEGEAQGRVR